MTAEEDYPRQLKALRISGTVLLLVYGISTLGMLHKVSFYTAIFESMMDPKDAVPRVTAFVIKNQMPLIAMGAVVIFGSIWGLWMSRRISSLIYIAGGVVAFFTLLSEVVNLGMHQPFLGLVTKFQF